MLNDRNLDDRTYEELMAEAMVEIPMYSKEWTNFNPSDPGVTILENLTAFEILQQNHINEITPAIRARLLKLVGFEAQKGRCARVLLAADHLRRDLTLWTNQKFFLGDVCFETNRPLSLKPCRLKGIWGLRQGQWQEFPHLLEREVRVPVPVFGKVPAEGDSLWFLSDGLPEACGELTLYFQAEENRNRNPFEEKKNNPFADIQWECYTVEGFVPMHVKDDTAGFLLSGEVRDAVLAGDETQSSQGRAAYRGVTYRGGGIWKDLQGGAGGSFVTGSLTSTTQDAAIAAQFYDISASENRAIVRYHLAGKGAVRVSDMSVFEQEAEVLLPIGTKLSIRHKLAPAFYKTGSVHQIKYKEDLTAGEQAEIDSQGDVPQKWFDQLPSGVWVQVQMIELDEVWL